MQKYFNIIYTILLVVLIAFVVKIQLFDEVNDVQKSLDRQAQTMDQLQGDIQNIVSAINQELQSSAAEQGQTPPPALETTSGDE
ncbi:MAG: hypothetical protein U1C18_00645 [Patescibacteria group bacterium]|nr:hypothetical protein [Patescibacteria group bacterium]